jgi:hypothetical protein
VEEEIVESTTNTSRGTRSASNGSTEVQSIERRENLSYRDFVQEYLNPMKPVILTDAISEWPAASRWTPEFLKREYGDAVAKLRSGGTVTIGEFIDHVLVSDDDNPAPYLFGFEIEELFPGLTADLQPGLRYAVGDRLSSPFMPARMRAQLNRIVEMLIGGRGGRFPLHYDIYHTHGFVTQVYGDKEFILFSPEDSPFLYSNPESPNRSLVDDLDKPDLDRFPLFAKATPLKATVRAGETIFNPGGWWHSTRMLTPSIAVVQSTVSSSCWSDFVHDLFAWQDEISPLKATAKRAYLRAAGVLMSAAERRLVA